MRTPFSSFKIGLIACCGLCFNLSPLFAEEQIPVRLELSVGDDSGSHSERYNMIIKDKESGSTLLLHQATQFGVVATQVYNQFRKGKTYEVSLVHTGTDPGYLQNNDNKPDYDYFAEVKEPNDSKTCNGDKTVLIIQDEEGILGDHNESDYFYAQGKTALIILPDIEIKEIISDQLPGRECNKLPPTINPSKNKPMLMAARTAEEAHVVIKCESPLKPKEIEDKSYVGVRKEGNTQIIKSMKIEDPEKIEFDFTAEDGENIYEIIAGVDANESGDLTEDEVVTVYEDGVQVITEWDYIAGKNFLSSIEFFTLGIDSQNLDAFLTQETPDDAVVSQFNFSTSEKGLTHPLGAHWSGGCQTQAKLYSHPEGNWVSDNVENSVTVKNTIFHYLDQKQTQIKAQLQSFFATNANATSCVISQISYSNDGIGETFTDNQGKSSLDKELHYAFGRATITGTFSITVAKNNFQLLSINYNGIFYDLYDFDYTGGNLAKAAAKVQAGFASLGEAGKVYKSFVEFSKIRNDWEYNFQ